MPHITLTEEQAQLISQAEGPVDVYDPEGRPIASLTPFDAAEIAAILRAREIRGRMEPGIPSAQVQAHLKKLEEISQREPLDQARVLELLRRMRAGEAV